MKENQYNVTFFNQGWFVRLWVQNFEMNHRLKLLNLGITE